MFHVVYKGTNKIYTILEFEELSEGEKVTIKDGLICPGCREGAHYRVGGRDGRRATFAARHIEGCTEEKSSKGKIGDKEIEVVKSFIDNNIIRIDLNISGGSSSGKNKIIKDTAEDKEDKNKTTRRHVIDSDIKKPLKLNMKQILMVLLNTSNFESKRIIMPGSKKELLAKDVFIHSSQILKREFDNERFFWGKTSKIQPAADNFWINTGKDINGFSILINDKVSKLFLEKYDTEDEERIKNSVFLVYGKLLYGKKTEKPFIIISNLDYLIIEENNN